jgi:hypothetical protein
MSVATALWSRTRRRWRPWSRHFVRDDGGRFALNSSCYADLDCLRQLQRYLQVA